MRFDERGIPWGKGPFRRTKRVTLELSNHCNLAHRHTRCPLHRRHAAAILPESIVHSVLTTCQKHDFEGVISFHLYNEPLCDPRLFYFMGKVKAILPRARLFLATNGWYLDQNLAGELESHGLDFLHISAYSREALRRFRRLDFSIPVRILSDGLDDRLTWYSKAAKPAPPQPCYCPLYEICISCSGTLILCPFDWKHKHQWGDLKNDSLETILNRTRPWELYRSLSEGRRRLTLCRNCPTSRGESFNGDNKGSAHEKRG